MSLVPHDYRRFQQDRKERSVRFDHWTLAEMRRERQVVTERIAELAGNLPASASTADPSVRFLIVQLEDLDGAVARRERVGLRPIGNGRRDDDLLQFARSLKQLWPVERFCREMLLMELKPVGKELVGRCPFPEHHDRTPSFKINPEKDVWHCWGKCGRGGDLYLLAGLLRGEERFARQVEIVADAVGITQGAA